MSLPPELPPPTPGPRSVEERDRRHLYPVCSCSDLLADSLDAFRFAVDKLCTGDVLDAVLVQVKRTLRTWARRGAIAESTPVFSTPFAGLLIRRHVLRNAP